MRTSKCHKHKNHNIATKKLEKNIMKYAKTYMTLYVSYSLADRQTSHPIKKTILVLINIPNLLPSKYVTQASLK